MENNTDLCKTCKHYWVDYPMPLEIVISHCEILDAKSINQNMNEVVPYPCVRCPFNKYEKNNYFLFYKYMIFNEIEKNYIFL